MTPFRRRYQLRYHRFEDRPFLILDVEHPARRPVFAFLPADRRFAVRTLDELNGEQEWDPLELLEGTAA